MNPNDYFRYTEDYFWTWEDEGDVIAITEGSTIIYTEELIQILDAVTIYGLPSFGSLLLTIIATNSTIDNSVNYISELLKKIFKTNDFRSFVTLDILNEAISFLELLHKLPEKLKSKKTRHLLLQIIFKEAHNRVNQKTAVGIINYFKSKDIVQFKRIRPYEPHRFSKDINTLSNLYKKFNSTQSIIDAFYLEIDIERIDDIQLETIASENKEYTDIIEELIDHQSTYQVGTLIKPIWAGLNIPIFNSNSSDQPLGGYSDISNKGNFDKLLVSEFANDDLVFMMRVANNEALYLHRELPPVTDKQKRYMLIDTSIKNWGTPKLINLAASIALSHHPKSKFENIIYTIAHTYDIVDPTNIEAIIEAQQRVSISLDASMGLAAFASGFKSDKSLELFYFTNSESLKSSSILRLLIDHSKLIKFIITSDIDGNMTIYINKNGSLKPIHTIQLDLKKYWDTKPQIKDSIPKEKIELVSMPILSPFPNAKQPQIFHPTDSDVFIANGRSLYKSYSAELKFSFRGFELIQMDLNPNGNICIGRNRKLEFVLLEYIKSEKTFKATNLRTNQKLTNQNAEIKGKSNKNIIFENGKFILFGSSTANYTIEPYFDNNLLQINEFEYSYELRVQYNKADSSAWKSGQDLKFNKQTILTKINSVYINGHNKLIINKRSFEINREEFYLCDMSYDSISLIKKNEAISTKKNKYKFVDGSTISFMQNDIVVLQSSNKSIPTIYFPLVVDDTIAMATDAYFAGNVYFYNSTRQNANLQLTNRGNNVIEAIKIIRFYTQLGLQEVKNGLDILPFNIPNLSEEIVKKLQDSLIPLGINSIYKPPIYPSQNIIEVNDFMEKFMTPFIENILNYESRN